MTGHLVRWRFGDDVEPLREHLLAGGVAAIPSESSYGLACDARSERGVEAIYRLKSRDRGKPLPIVAGGVEQLQVLHIDTASPAVRAAATLWPAAFSAVLPFPSAKAWPAAAGGATLAVRVPAHARLRELVTAVGFPLTATSANAAGEAPFLDPDALAGWLAEARNAAKEAADERYVLVDGGRLPGGAPSTLAVPDGRSWRILRHGRVAESDLPTIPVPT